MRFRKCALWSLVVIGLAGSAQIAVAQEMSGGRDVILTLPVISLTEDSTGHLKMNLGGKAGLAVEASLVREFERVGEEEMAETGESMITKGRSFALLVSRYTNPDVLGGFFWSLGIGYRQIDVRWRVRPDANDPEVDMTLVDEMQRLNHHGTLSGMTGHGRLGYRYVGTDYPFLIGAFVGLRHFQASVKNAYDGEKVEDRESGLADLTGDEKDSLRRQFKTALEPGLELGFAF